MFNDGCMPPETRKKLNDFDEWERFGGFPMYASSPKKAKQKSEAFFQRYVKENKLENHVFIQWANGGMKAIPCFGDKRGNWLAGFDGLFRTQEQLNHFDEQHKHGNYKHYSELEYHL